mmetsp:Transcript_91769/g.268606  ORF Transcript_91769/g.268606 Transcript_91769/m.268606 type:complete len:230 (-) Transcript_91769:429-1118(-)
MEFEASAGARNSREATVSCGGSGATAPAPCSESSPAPSDCSTGCMASGFTPTSNQVLPLSSSPSSLEAPPEVEPSPSSSSGSCRESGAYSDLPPRLRLLRGSRASATPPRAKQSSAAARSQPRGLWPGAPPAWPLPLPRSPWPPSQPPRGTTGSPAHCRGPPTASGSRIAATALPPRRRQTSVDGTKVKYSQPFSCRQRLWQAVALGALPDSASERRASPPFGASAGAS